MAVINLSVPQQAVRLHTKIGCVKSTTGLVIALSFSLYMSHRNNARIARQHCAFLWRMLGLFGWVLPPAFGWVCGRHLASHGLVRRRAMACVFLD